MYKKCSDKKVKQKIMWIITHFNCYYKNSAAKIQITKEDLAGDLNG